MDHAVAACISSIVAAPYLRAYFDFPQWTYAVPGLLLLTIGGLRAFGNDRVQRSLAAYLVTMFLLILWLTMSAGWSKSETQVYDSLQLLLAWAVVGLGCAAAVSRNVVRLVPGYVALLGGVAGVHVLLGYMTSHDLTGYKAGVYSAYLVAGSLTGVGAICAACIAARQGRLRHRALWGSVAIGCFGGVALSLARGALLFSLFITCIATLYLLVAEGRAITYQQGGWRLRKGPFVVGLAIVAVLAGAIAGAMQIERTAVRIMRLFGGNELVAGGRGQLWSTALDSIYYHPWFGYGLGFSGTASGTNEGLYPHNLLLQTWLDGGVVAASLTVVWIGLPFATALVGSRKSQAFDWVPVLASFSFFVLEYLKSGDFYTARTIVLFGVLVTASSISSGWPNRVIDSNRGQG